MSYKNDKIFLEDRPLYAGHTKTKSCQGAITPLPVDIHGRLRRRDEGAGLGPGYFLY